jgi:hypothetical protein
MTAARVLATSDSAVEMTSAARVRLRGLAAWAGRVNMIFLLLAEFVRSLRREMGSATIIYGEALVSEKSMRR